MRSLALVLIVFALCTLGHPATLEMTSGPVGELLQATVETAHYRLTVDAASGARVTSLLDKALGVDIVRREESGLGGLFEDRPCFSTSRYTGRIVEQSDARIVLAFSVKNDDGVAVTKTLTFTEGRPTFEVRWEIANGSQLPFTLWVRNFATPGGGEATEADRAFVVKQPEGTLQELTFPDGYFSAVDQPWIALLDTERRSGFFVRCEPALLDRFYFWSGSRLIPTFEWVYKPVPAGMATSTGLLFGLVKGVKRVGHVDAAGNVSETEQPGLGRPVEPQFTPVPGWRPVEELYAPSEIERDRGFILTVSGTQAPKPRLERLEVDLGLDERDAVPLEVFVLAEETKVSAKVTGEIAPAVKIRVEEDFWLRDGAELTVSRGHYGRLWLTVDSSGLAPGEYKGEVQISSGAGEPSVLPLRVTVWNTRLPGRTSIGVQMYAFLPTLSACDLDVAARKRFMAYIKNLQELRVDTCEWAVAPYYPASCATIKGTRQLLSEWVKEHPHVRAGDLPDVEFGYYDLWFDECAKRGMTRFIVHVPAVNGWREASTAAIALGREVPADSEECWQVVLWFYSQLRRYASQKGFTAFYAKIDDEIPQEHIPAWNEGARRYQSIGYKTYTTNTGNIARSAKLLEQMNETSDAWQVALCLSRDFMDLTRKSASYEQRREVCDLAWGLYTNGGAVDTWATTQPFFAGERPVDRVDDIQVFADGVPLTMRDGSGWGNKDHGVGFVYGGHLYVSLPDGGEPRNARVEVAYRLRTVNEGGTPAVRLKPDAEVWYYGGGNYRSAYEATRAYPWRVCAYDMVGYGFWTYLWWNEKDILVKINPETFELALSPAWEGLRDGNEDAAYFRAAEERLKAAGDAEGVARLRSVFATDEGAPLRMGETRAEVYAWYDFLQPTYAAYNAAKRAALAALAG